MSARAVRPPPSASLPPLPSPLPRSYWDFAKLDEGMLDFLTAANSSSRTSIPNFSTIPNWLFKNADRCVADLTSPH